MLLQTDDQKRLKLDVKMKLYLANSSFSRNCTPGTVHLVETIPGTVCLEETVPGKYFV